jgi:hypothetical protein
VLEFADHATTAITWETWPKRVGVAQAVLCVAAAVLQILIWSCRGMKNSKQIELKLKNLRNFLISLEKNLRFSGESFEPFSCK